MFGPALAGQPRDRVQGARARRSTCPPAGRLVRLLERRAPSPAGRRSTSPRRYDRDPPSTSAPARSSRRAPRSSTPTRSPPTRITLYVYAGADGAFTLYEDEGEDMATSAASSPASRCAGTTRRGRSRSASARAASPGWRPPAGSESSCTATPADRCSSKRPNAGSTILARR